MINKHRSTCLAGLLLVAALSAGGLRHLLDGLFDVLPLLVQVVLGAVGGRVVVGLYLHTAVNTRKRSNLLFGAVY